LVNGLVLTAVRAACGVWRVCWPGGRAVAGVDGGWRLSALAARRPGTPLPCAQWHDDGGADHRHRDYDRAGHAGGALPTRIAGGGADSGRLGRQYDVTRDGQFRINAVLDEATAPITLSLNWTPEAKQ